jgi:hypothetical protein
LMKANGRVQAGYSIAKVGGPLLGGLLIIVLPLQMLMLIDACSYLISAISLVLVTASFNDSANESLTSTSLRQDIVEGLRYVLKHAILSWITLLLLFVNFILPNTNVQLVLFIISTYSLTQTAVPNQLFGRVITVIRVLTWSTASLGALLGGLVIQRTDQVALAYAVAGLLIFGISFLFFFTPLGHSETYLSKSPPPI